MIIAAPVSLHEETFTVNRLDSPLGSALRRVDWIAAAAVGLLALTGIGMAWLNARSYGQELLTPSSLLVRSLTWTLLSIAVYSVTTLVNWRWVRTFAWPLYAANSLANQSEHGDVRYLHRRANLEDVFLKLTGRELRD